MTHPSSQHDVFAVQSDLLDGLPQRDPAPPLDVIRARLSALLTTAQAAERLPWDPQRARVNALLFHNMANWLPPGERDDLRAAFAQQLKRLGAKTADELRSL
jgi:hypothetical protein